MLSLFTPNGKIRSWMCKSNNTSRPNLDIFQTIKLVTKEMPICKCYQVDSKEIKCPLQWWAKQKPCFLLLIFWLVKS